LRREHPVFRRRQFLHGAPVEGSVLSDAWWFRPDGRRMTRRDWDGSHVVGMFLNGDAIAGPDSEGRRVVDDSFLLLFNGSHEDVEFKLPPVRFGPRWTVELRTDETTGSNGTTSAGEVITVPELSLIVLRRER
jgi:isoamylase